jgi:hypothetical protein
MFVFNEEKAVITLYNNAQNFMECLVSDKFWVLVAQFTTYLSNLQTFDDCAYDVDEEDLKHFKVNPMPKTNPPYSWKELIIQNGHVQMLVIGGIYSKIEDNRTLSPFLGTSFPFLFNDEEIRCYCKKQPVEVMSSIGSMIGHRKLSSKLKAEFISLHIIEKLDSSAQTHYFLLERLKSK